MEAVTLILTVGTMLNRLKRSDYTNDGRMEGATQTTSSWWDGWRVTAEMGLEELQPRGPHTGRRTPVAL